MVNYHLANRMISAEEAARLRVSAIRSGEPTNIIDPIVDEQWARLFQQSGAPNSYYDYFFSGADIKAYIAELGDDSEFGDLPIHAIGYSVEQQKQPVYGYASYTFDAVMRGTRIVTGTFTLISRHPGYFRRALNKAALNRSSRTQGALKDRYSNNRLTEDDANIVQYWNKNMDVGIVGVNEFSVHPPFNFVIVFGLQDTSMSATNPLSIYNQHENDNALFSDHNQRLVSGEPRLPDRIVLEACELQGVQQQFAPDGIVVESYQFFARDFVIPPPRTPVGQKTPIQ